MPQDSLSTEEKASIRQAIMAAEQNTSGEIRVHLENHCKDDPIGRALTVFEKLEMHRTDQRNGVLFYLALKDHQFAILGDEGINKVVPMDFWEDIKVKMQADFREGKIAKGLAEGIRMAGEQLGAHFPYRSDDKNELSDDISFGK
ncbi:MAG: TPM domain-containing protein [Cyclobacteriaceae bacterium]